MLRAEPPSASVHQAPAHLPQTACGVRIREHKGDVARARVARLTALFGPSVLALRRRGRSLHLKGIMSGDQANVEYP